MTYDFKESDLIKKLTPRLCRTPVGVVEYLEYGTGPVVVCLHGAMGGCDQGLILAQAIGSAGFRYLALSRPGYLGTPLSSGKSPEAQGDLVAGLLDSLGVAQAGVMAVSAGGPCAIRFGLQHPDRCNGLVLASTCAGRVAARIPFSFRITSHLARFAWIGRRLHEKARKDTAAVAARSIRDPEVLSRTINDPDIWPLFQTMLLSTFDRMHLRMDGTLNDIRITQSTGYPLEDLNVPVLAIHGAKDPMLPIDDHGRAFARRVPDAELLAVEGGEHVAIFTHRDEVGAKVAGFMEDHFR